MKGALVAATLAVLLAEPAKAEGPVEEGAMAVTVVSAKTHCFTNRLAASGTFVARHAVELLPDREGLVVSDVAVEAGDTVTKDQVLAHLASPQNPKEEIAVKAPVAGTVIAAAAVVGAYVSPGTGDPLFRIAEGGDVELSAESLAKNVPLLRRGMAAKVHVVGLGELDGRVAAIDDGVDARTQLAVLHLTVAADPRLRVGSFARAEIDAGQDCGLTIPLSALLFGPDGDVVSIVQSDRVVMRRVTTGLLEGGTIEIRDGLIVNDSVIARAGPFLREGDPVRPIPDAR